MIESFKLVEYCGILSETISQLDFLCVLHESKNVSTLNSIKKLIECIDTAVTSEFICRLVGYIHISCPSIYDNKTSQILVYEDELYNMVDEAQLNQHHMLHLNFVYLLELFKDCHLEIQSTNGYKRFRESVVFLKMKSNFLTDICASLSSNPNLIHDLEEEFESIKRRQQAIVTDELDGLIKDKRTMYAKKYVDNLRFKRYYDRWISVRSVEAKKPIEASVNKLKAAKDRLTQMHRNESDLFPLQLQLHKKELEKLKTIESEWNVKCSQTTEELNEKLDVMRNKLKKIQKAHQSLKQKYIEYENFIKEARQQNSF